MTDPTNDTDSKQLDLGGDETAEGEIKADEIRANAREDLKECDGAMVVTATIVRREDDDDGLRLNIGVFVEDDLPDDDREALRNALYHHAHEEVMEAAEPAGVGLAGGTPIAVSGPEELAALLGGLAEAQRDMEDAEDETEAEAGEDRTFQ